jgi:hypothetical protein
MATGRYFPYMGIHLGTATSFATFNESTLNASGAGPWLGQLGMVVEEGNKVYRLVKFDSGTNAVASAAGGVAHWKDRDNYIVTSDHASAQATTNGIAGGFLGVQTTLYYCFVQLGGKQAVTVTTTAAAGTVLIGSTTDLTLIAAATTSGNAVQYAVSYGTNSTTSANVFWLLGNLL